MIADREDWPTAHSAPPRELIKSPSAACTLLIYSSKAVELLISAIFVGLCGYELYKQVKAYGWKMQWRFFAIVFMITSLLSNVAL